MKKQTNSSPMHDMTIIFLAQIFTRTFFSGKFAPRSPENSGLWLTSDAPGIAYQNINVPNVTIERFLVC